MTRLRDKSVGVLLLHNHPAAALARESGAGACPESEINVLDAVLHVDAALAELGVRRRVAGITRLSDLPPLLADADFQAVFNLVEDLEDDPCAAHEVPTVCKSFGRACTGGDTAALLLTLDKALTTARLAQHGIRVPASVVVPPGAPPPARLPAPPLFVKPLAADASEGISPASLVRDPAAELADAVGRIHRECGQPALVEPFIEGREINLAVMERLGEPCPLPPAEIDFSLFPPGRGHFVDYEIKWRPGTIPGHLSPRRIPADLGAARTARLRELACRVWRVCGCRDYARIDCRLDTRGRVHVLEVNINCDLSPLAGFAHALAVAGIPFSAFVAQTVENALSRRQARRGPSGR